MGQPSYRLAPPPTDDHFAGDVRFTLPHAHTRTRSRVRSLVTSIYTLEAAPTRFALSLFIFHFSFFIFLFAHATVNKPLEAVHLELSLDFKSSKSIKKQNRAEQSRAEQSRAEQSKRVSRPCHFTRHCGCGGGVGVLCGSRGCCG